MHACRWEVASHRPSSPSPSSSARASPSNSSSRSRGSGAGQTEAAGSYGSGFKDSTGLTSKILLQLHRGAVAKPGDELCINYGDTKSNEELLLLYGFVLDPTLEGRSMPGKLPYKPMTITHPLSAIETFHYAALRTLLRD